MRITIARLRVWIVGVAFLLLAVLTGFFFYARYKAHRLITDLPGRLGATIARSSDGFTYSQSVKGRTAFTIHASKVVQFTGGASATLHDVVITLYGTQGDRGDRISGSEFNYDQKAGIVSAQGAVCRVQHPQRRGPFHRSRLRCPEGPAGPRLRRRTHLQPRRKAGHRPRRPCRVPAQQPPGLSPQSGHRLSG